jgi:hypothetical protein
VSDTIETIQLRIRAFKHFRDLNPDKCYTSSEAEDAIALSEEVERLSARPMGCTWDSEGRPLTVCHELATLRSELRDYETLKRAVNESTNECGPDCDEHGHGDNCPANSAARWLEDQQREIDRE